jgi:methyl-accepting chemotaxis protein WspA
MKSWTIATRLYVFFGLTLLALAGAFGLFVHADSIENLATERDSRLDHAAAVIRYDLLEMSDALRGLIIDPANQAARQSKLAADEHFAKTIEAMKPLLQGQPDLLKAIAAVGDNDDAKLNRIENELMDLVPKDNAAARAFYANSYQPANHEQDKLVTHFIELVANDSTSAIDLARHGRSQALEIMAAIFGVAVIGLFFFARSLSRPLQQLTAAVRVLAEGNLSATLPEARGAAEIGQLTGSFGRMVENLTTLVGQVQKSGIQVNTSATEIAATTKQQQATSSEIAATTTEIGATSNEIAATSKELVKTIGEVARTADETAHIAGEGRAGLTRMETTMTRVTDAVGNISGKLAVLNEKAGNINTVVTTITQVADQTNLLSLNAAIEAEKAGEFGRGFAVVAREIRRLADQTAVASSDIGEMVREMQSAVSAGVMGMDKFSEEVRRAVAEVRTASAQLAQIIEQVQALTPRIETVNEGMQAQATGATQISEALAQLSDAARQTAESLRQSNEAIQQLNEATNGLQRGVARFTLRNN